MYNYNSVLVYDPLVISGGYPSEHEIPILKEDGLKIYPGDLLQMNEGSVKLHGQKGGLVRPAFVAMINPYSADLFRSKHPLDCPYIFRNDDGEVQQVVCISATRGQKLYMRIKSTVSEGDFLCSSGDGALETGDTNVFAVALESVTVEDAPARVLVEVA